MHHAGSGGRVKRRVASYLYRVATLVLCQGFFGRFFEWAADGIGPVRVPSVRYFGGIKEILEGEGHRVLTPQSHPSAGIARRAGEIRQYLRQHLRTDGASC